MTPRLGNGSTYLNSWISFAGGFLCPSEQYVYTKKYNFVYSVYTKKENFVYKDDGELEIFDSCSASPATFVRDSQRNA